MAEFRVFIAESNNPLDFHLGRLDGHAANEVLKVPRIPSLYRVVLDRKMLKKAVAEAGRFETDIFHLSCHGDETGIQLADGEELGWEELADELTPLASRSRILVNSSCAGAHRGLRAGGRIRGIWRGSSSWGDRLADPAGDGKAQGETVLTYVGSLWQQGEVLRICSRHSRYIRVPSESA
jgi:hypothetical protein